jgi:hypothetical protein
VDSLAWFSGVVRVRLPAWAVQLPVELVPRGHGCRCGGWGVAAELVRQAREKGLSLTGPDGLLKQLT